MVDSISANYLKAVQSPQFAAKVSAYTTPPEEQKPQVPAFMGKSEEIASKESAEALKSYVTPQINKSVMTSTSNEYVEQLKKSGKVEGKDFTIEEFKHCVDVNELDSNGNVIKSSAWQTTGDKEKPLGYDEFTYEKGRIWYRDAKKTNGKLDFHAHYYYNDEVPQDIISHDGLTADTKIEDYVKNIHEKGVKYRERITKAPDGTGTSRIVEEYDDNGNLTLKTIWEENTKNPKFNHIVRDLIDANGTITTSILLDDEKTVVVNYMK